MITLENHATSRALGYQPGRRGIEVCIEGVQRPNGAVTLGIVVNGMDCRQKHYG